MESEALQQTNSTIIKRRPHFRVPGMNLTGLIRLGKRMKTMKREAFRRKYGNLLSLMEVDVSSLAITTLSQYYDSPLRCFTFQDFQLAPTIEEFEHILGSPLEGTTPYQHLEHHASITTIVIIMKLPPRELEDRLVARNHVRGLTLEYLEQYLHHLADNEERETFMDVFALTLYDIMLFPKIEDFVNYGAIDAFVAKKTSAENPVTTILADVYGTMSFCHERKGQQIICCLPALYQWLTSRMFKGTIDKNMGIEEWAHFFAGINGGKIKWRPSWLRGRGFIHYCGNFPKIPLIGARYCINYNPTLVQRQFGHPMKGAPSSYYLTPLFIYYEDGGFTKKLREIRRAWGNVMRFEADERTGVINQEVSYHNWITQRVKDIKLSFKSITGQLADERKFLNPESYKVKQLEREIEEVKNQNAKLIKELRNARNDVVDLRAEKEEMTRAYEEVLRKQSIERDYTLRIKQDLAAASTELALRVKERNTALEAEEHWRYLYEETKRDRQEAQIQVKEIEGQMKMMAMSFEVELDQEREEAEERRQAVVKQVESCIAKQARLIEVEERNQALMRQMESHIHNQEQTVEHWRRNFSQLVALANGAIKDIPKMVSKAEIMTHFCNPPEEVTLFISYCKQLVGEMKTFIARARN